MKNNKRQNLQQTLASVDTVNFRSGIGGSWYRSLLVLLLAGLLQGCATVEPDFTDPRDPLESFNRAMYNFNDGLDRVVVKPVSKGYRAVVPDPVDRGVTNFFYNLDDVRSVLNNLLQFKFKHAASDTGRFLVNSTAGILGFRDVATGMGMPRHDEDFGQTLGVWGFAPGPYLVLPVIGPSSGRDALGWLGDWYSNPLYFVDDSTLRWSLYILRFVDRRSDLLTASSVLDAAALDPYVFVRESYLQKREMQVYDGNPPEQEDFFK